MLRLRFFLAIPIALGVLASAHAQVYSKWLFNVGGGIGFPQADLRSFVNDGILLSGEDIASPRISPWTANTCGKTCPSTR